MKEDVKEIAIEHSQSEEVLTIGESATDAVAYNDLSRRDVRALIFYLLYAAEAFDYEESLAAIVDNFNRGFSLDIPYDSEVVRIAQAIINERGLLDELFKPLLANWRFERLGVSTKLILRFATWELEHSDTDSRIVINEAVELAKAFAEKDAYKFVNGVLDRLVKKKVEVPLSA